MFIGTAAFTIPKIAKPLFPAERSHLERYSQVLSCVEINSSFYRHHKAATYQRWSDSTPEGFRFSVKLSRELTHVAKLNVTTEALKAILAPILTMKKLGVLLVQLPPSLRLDSRVANTFFSRLRSQFEGSIAVEPRHSTWVGPAGQEIFTQFNLTKVKADPEVCPGDVGAGDIEYLRLHGSPEIYKSEYSEGFLKNLLPELASSKPAWVIFDNTTYGYATLNAVTLTHFLNATHVTTTNAEFPHRPIDPLDIRQ